MAQVPLWITTEVAARLENVARGGEPGQFYARCPVPRHGDHHRSFSFRAGDQVALVFSCQKDCTNEEIREALISRGVPDEYLGVLGTPDYEQRRRVRAQSPDNWREVERLRREMLDLKNMLRGLLDADLTLAMVKVRLLAVADGVEIPTGRKEYVEFAMSAGVSQPRAYAAWKSDPLAQARTQCVTADHVVLARSGEEGQAVQATVQDGVIETINPFSDREFANLGEPGSYRNDNSRNENDETEAAMSALRDAGLTKPAA